MFNFFKKKTHTSAQPVPSANPVPGAIVLSEYRISFSKAQSGTQTIDPDKSGERSKLGGTPDWDQEDETPICPDCGQFMSFIGQIDSIHHDSETNPHRIPCLSGEQEYMFGDVGMIYVFFCFKCCQSKSVFQCA